MVFAYVCWFLVVMFKMRDKRSNFINTIVKEESIP